jgi:hypothetical protein
MTDTGTQTERCCPAETTDATTGRLWYCTLNANHPGPHVAGGAPGEIFATWDDDVEATA